MHMNNNADAGVHLIMHASAKTRLWSEGENVQAGTQGSYQQRSSKWSRSRSIWATIVEPRLVLANAAAVRNERNDTGVGLASWSGASQNTINGRGWYWQRWSRWETDEMIQALVVYASWSGASQNRAISFVLYPFCCPFCTRKDDFFLETARGYMAWVKCASFRHSSVDFFFLMVSILQ